MAVVNGFLENTKVCLNWGYYDRKSII